MKAKYRTLKIYPKHHRRVFDNIIVPEIRLEGKWLKELGFRQGMKVKIKQQAKKLTITIVE